jgi:hypothetical protein
MRQNTLDTIFYGVLIPESTYSYKDLAGKTVTHTTPEHLSSASKTNMPALYMSEKVARSYNGDDANIIKVKVVRA